MAVAIPNFRFSYRRKGKPVFVPTGVGKRIGNEIKDQVAEAYEFHPMFYHLKSGGHVAAMHLHRPNLTFARIDITRFFYSISRRRVQSALDRIGLGNVAFYAKWSTVKNPYGDPLYALPYGFVQSPILASLVLATGKVGEYLEALPASVSTTVYMDDIVLSSLDEGDLQHAFESTAIALEEDGFMISADKLRRPSVKIDVFNCDMSVGRTSVRDERIATFFAKAPSPVSEEAFIAYCATVEEGNRP
jgi:hypothetical protein